MGSRGRLPQPQHLRVLRGDGRPSRATKPPIEPAIAPGPPAPPSWLPKAARREWRAVAPELHRLGLLTELDVGPLAGWCVAVTCWKDAIALPENARQPKIIRDAAREMTRLGQQFGLAGPASRARLAGHGKQQPTSKFDGLLGA